MRDGGKEVQILKHLKEANNAFIITDNDIDNLDLCYKDKYLLYKIVWTNEEDCHIMVGLAVFIVNINEAKDKK